MNTNLYFYIFGIIFVIIGLALYFIDKIPNNIRIYIAISIFILGIILFFIPIFILFSKYSYKNISDYRESKKYDKEKKEREEREEREKKERDKEILINFDKSFNKLYELYEEYKLLNAEYRSSYNTVYYNEQIEKINEKMKPILNETKNIYNNLSRQSKNDFSRFINSDQITRSLSSVYYNFMHNLSDNINRQNEDYFDKLKAFLLGNFNLPKIRLF